MATVLAVGDQHHQDPNLLLLLGYDGRGARIDRNRLRRFGGGCGRPRTGSHVSAGMGRNDKQTGVKTALRVGALQRLAPVPPEWRSSSRG